MKSTVKSLAMSAAFLAALPLVANAQQLLRLFPFPTKPVPELDPSSAATAIGFLVGGVLMLAGRRRANR
jgi:hypothetical protein